MAGKTLINIEKPQTQTVKAVCALLAWKGRPSNPLPEFVEMGKGDSRLVLVLSNKKDAYYCVTAKDCSCPARNWHPNGPCKHMRRYFPESKQASKPATDAPKAGKWHGHNGPWIESEVRPVKAASSLSVIDCHDTTDRDAAYHSIKTDRHMWPVEA